MVGKKKKYKPVSTRLQMKERRIDHSIASELDKDGESDQKIANNEISKEKSCNETVSVQYISDGVVNLWPAGRIPYVFEQDFSLEEKMHVVATMGHIEGATNFQVKFIDIFEEIPDSGGYMSIRFGDNYEATLGFVEDEPTILILVEETIDDKMGTVMHELLHGLGIRHEHNRPDRDNYVKIVWENIDEDELHNFEKSTPEEYETFGVPYNYYSVMHYASHSFGKDSRLPTILFNDDTVANEFIGQRSFLTMEDIELLKYKYKYEAPRY